MANVFSNMPGLDTSKYLKDGFNTYVFGSGKYMQPGEGGAPISFSLPENWSYQSPGQWMQPFYKSFDPSTSDWIEKAYTPDNWANDPLGKGFLDESKGLSRFFKTGENPLQSVQFDKNGEDFSQNLIWKPVENPITQGSLYQMPNPGGSSSDRPIAEGAAAKPFWWDTLASQGKLPQWGTMDERFFYDNPELANAVRTTANAGLHNQVNEHGIFGLKEIWRDLGPFITAAAGGALASYAGAGAGAAGGLAEGTGSGFNALHAADASWLPGSSLGAAESAAALGNAAGAGVNFAGNAAEGLPSWATNQAAQSATPLLDSLSTVPNYADISSLGSLTPSVTPAINLGSGVVNLANSAGPTVAETAVPNVLNQVKTAADTASKVNTVKKWLSDKTGLPEAAIDALGIGASTLLNLYGNSQQQGALEDVLNKARGDRAPFLAKANALLSGGPEAYAAGEGSGAMRGVLAALSAKYGNPIGSGTALALANQAALNDWRSAVGQFANLGLAGEDNQLRLGSQLAGMEGNNSTILGGALGQLLNPPKKTDTAQLLDLMKQAGLV